MIIIFGYSPFLNKPQQSYRNSFFVSHDLPIENHFPVSEARQRRVPMKNCHPFP